MLLDVAAVGKSWCCFSISVVAAVPCTLSRAAAGQTRASHGLLPPVSEPEGEARGRSSWPAGCAGAKHPAGDGGRAGQGAKQDTKHLRGELEPHAGLALPQGSSEELQGWGQPGGKSWGWHPPSSVPAALEGARSPPGGAASLLPYQLPPRVLRSPGWEAAMPSGTAPALGAHRGPVGLRDPKCSPSAVSSPLVASSHFCLPSASLCSSCRLSG